MASSFSHVADLSELRYGDDDIVGTRYACLEEFDAVQAEFAHLEKVLTAGLARPPDRLRDTTRSKRAGMNVVPSSWDWILTIPHILAIPAHYGIAPFGMSREGFES